VGQKFWKHISEVSLRLETVVKDNDGPGAGRINRTAQTLLRRNGPGIVVGKYIPHHDLVLVCQRLDLRPRDAAVRRTKKSRRQRLTQFHLTLTLRYVFQIALPGSAPSFQVVEGMIADGVTLPQYLVKDCWVFAYVVANAKKGSPRVVVA